MIDTTVVDKTLNTMRLKTQEGLILTTENVVDGQKEIFDCILKRKAPDGKNKVHVMAHTRFGKSIIVGAGVAVRASMKGEKWAIVAPTKEQAQIIMDYVLFFSVNDPIISQLLKVDARVLKNEQLTQRRSRDHITYLNGGEVRTFSSKQTMGFGAPNIVLDEASVVEDEDEAKAFRMLGDNPTDFFIMKIGNPFLNNHFQKAFTDPSYYHINIDATRGLKEGRLSQAILDEQKSKPNYDILYWNIFPDEESRDKHGYMPLFTHAMLKKAQIEVGALDSIGKVRRGCDPADGGQNMSAIVDRTNNIAEVKKKSYDLNNIEFADEIVLGHKSLNSIMVDKQGVGAGTFRRLEQAKEIKRKLIGVNSGLPVNQDDIPEDEDAKQYANLRAYMFWQSAQYLKGGGKLVKHEDWKMLLAVKWKRNSRGQIQIISKDELRSKYKVDDLGIADAFSYTFDPTQPEYYELDQEIERELHEEGAIGGVEPMYPDLGI